MTSNDYLDNISSFLYESNYVALHAASRYKIPISLLSGSGVMMTVNYVFKSCRCLMELYLYKTALIRVTFKRSMMGCFITFTVNKFSAVSYLCSLS